ncbi:polyketide cyclase / dehydrase and lipidtransport protein [Striga asiatica]|uniref:Polyketide cyclase / dehydrase and lipidtransport protein n=1 Tax=Striga asiatica TaxID=4170 RepID=A0A5A7P4Y9_STRAF|nr:polyketide cyclase / dehydrase and lipidtransport protein [Striga asiatica]
MDIPLFCTTATPRGCTISEPKISVAGPVLNTRYPNLTIVLDAKSSIAPRKIASFRFFRRNKPVIVCLSCFLARSHVLTLSKALYSQYRASFVKGDYGNNLDPADDDIDDVVEECIDETYDLVSDSESGDDCIEIEIEKIGKNSRRIRSKVVIQASLQAVWDLLTDYERLSDFIPGLAVSKLLDKRENFVRLYQIGEQNLAFGLKFNAKGTIDCFEKDLETLPSGQKRDIEFKMVEGDFQLFEGVWSIEQNVSGLETTLVYIVNVKPKVWLPVRLVEGRLSKEIRSNLSCIREEAEKAFRNTHSGL